jgi:tetratricopeptide (TPR) repeat protein
MARFRSMPSIGTHWRRLPSIKTIIITILVSIVALFAFANAAAQLGAKLPMFKPFGPAFYNDRVDLLRLEMAMAKLPAAAGDPRFGAMALETLSQSPLNARALRNYGLYREARGDVAGARRIFRVGDEISRRDGATQYWLINDAAKHGNVSGALDHFDSALRTLPEATQPMIEQLAISTLLPEARQALTRFVRNDNPWLVRYVQAGVAKLPKVEPLAQLFVDAKLAPEIPALKTSYGQIVEGLVSDRKIALLRHFYPLLSDADSRDLQRIVINEEAFKGGYAPVVWDLGQSSDRGGALLASPSGVSLELYGLPDTRGVAARKLLIPAASAQRFHWVATDRSSNEDSAAYWVLSCLRDGEESREVRSMNLLSPKSGLRGRLALPKGCDAIMISFEIDGGTGRDPARMVFNFVSVD